MKRVGVLGVGGIGGSLAAHLARAGLDPLCIEPWREHAGAMRFNGLFLDGVWGEFRVEVKAFHTSELANLPGPLEVLFVALKSFDTQRGLRLVRPYLASDGVVVTLQNGMNEEIISPIVGAHRTMGCVTTYNGMLMGPGHVRILASLALAMTTKPTCFTVGELDGRMTPRLSEVAGVLSAALPTQTTTDLLAERWAKLVTNCMVNPVCALTGLNSLDMRLHPGARRVSILLGAETVRVALAVGHRPPSLVGDLAPEDLLVAAEKGETPKVMEAFLRGTETRPPEHLIGQPSMLQDVLKGRPTEIDYINGYVARQGREAGVPTPVNEAAVALVTAVEARRLRPGVENLERLRIGISSGGTAF